MATQVPKHLTQELTTEIWRKYYNDPTLTTTDFSANLVGSVGDNYASIMTRAICKIHQNGKTFEKNMVIKTLPTGEGVLQYVEMIGAFKKEKEVLSKISPALEKILRNGGIDTKLTAECYYSDEKNTMIAMEDLSVEKFSVGNRFQGLPLENCKSVVKSLADFHAASCNLFKKEPSLRKNFPFVIYGETAQQREYSAPGLTDGLVTIIQHIDSWSSEKWSEKLKNLSGKLLEKLYNAVDKINENRPVVLNHGDLWVNNIMFRNDTEPRFVDLQLSFTQSPVYDLLYFIFTSASIEVQIPKIDEILKTYHDRLTQVCKLLNNELNYSFEDLQADFQENLIYGFVAFFYIHAIVSAPKDCAIDVSSADTSLMVGNPVFLQENFKKRFLAGLPFFEKRGMFQS